MPKEGPTPHIENGKAGRAALPRQDLVLIVLAVLSMAIYVIGQPYVNPDRLSTTRLSDAAAVEIANAFLNEHGFDATGTRSAVGRRRDSDLLSFLQNAVGRAELMRSNAGELQERTPLHYTIVEFTSGTGSERDTEFEVRLTAAGKPWYFRNSATPPGPEERRPTVDRAALNSAVAGRDTDVGNSTEDLSALSDSVIARRFVFSPRLFSTVRSPEPDGARRAGPLEQFRDRGFAMGREEAVALARYHLRRYALSGWDLDVDSTWLVPGERSAHVSFVARSEETGAVNRTEVAVAATGSLGQILANVESGEDTFGPDLEIASAVVAGCVFLVLGIILLVVFFRRLLNRAIDVKAALADGLVFSVLFLMFVLTSRGTISDGGSLFIRAVATAGLAVVGGTAAALAAFLISGAADSLARRWWSGKLLSTSLLRQGALLNGFVGASVIRGLAIGLTILALTTAVMWVFGDAVVVLERLPVYESTARPVIAGLGLSGLIAYSQTIIVVLTVAALLYGLRKSKLLAVAGITLAFTLILAAPVSFGNVWLTWATSALIGLVIATTFWRFDLLTVFSALSSSSLVWYLQEGWLVAGSPMLLDLLVVGAFFATVVAVGFIGIARGRNVPGVNEEFVPSYISELRQQERLQRELEIAHQVQESFLPHEMPDIDHLEIAATCIAAEVVGGDYYDLVKLGDGKLALAIGDVSGKGIQAAFFMTLTKGFLRSLCREHLSPGEVLRRMNRLFVESAPKGIFISIVYGVLDVTSGRFLFARAGHNPLILRRAGGDARHLQPSGMGIGLDPGPRFDRVIQESSVTLAPGDMLVLYTDGFSEARNHAHDEYGDDRLLASVSSAKAETARALMDDVCGDVDRFVQGAERHDDMTMLVVRLTGREVASTSEL